MSATPAYSSGVTVVVAYDVVCYEGEATKYTHVGRMPRKYLFAK